MSTHKLTRRDHLAALFAVLMLALASIACTDCLYEGSARTEPMCAYTPEPPPPTPALVPVPVR